MDFHLILKHCAREYPLVGWPGGLSVATNPAGIPAVLSTEKINLILYRNARQHFLFIENQSSMEECLQAGQ